jgi:hypothetical protein
VLEPLKEEQYYEVTTGPFCLSFSSFLACQLLYQSNLCNCFPFLPFQDKGAFLHYVTFEEPNGVDGWFYGHNDVCDA